jgi:hypothetical protein
VGIFSNIGNIGSTLMKLGGMAATFLGQPEIGVPLTIGGSALGGGTKGGWKGALMEGGKSGAMAGLSGGLGAFNTPVNDPISLASKGLTIPGGRTNPLDLGNMTVPASPKAFAGGS